MLALVCIAGTIALIVGEHVTTAKAEREHKADLIYIQKLGSELHHLAFEMKLKDIDTAMTPALRLQIRLWLVTPKTTTGNLSVYSWIGHSADSGWFMMGSENSRWNTIAMVTDSAATRVRFVFNEFGLTWKDRIYWQPDDIADFSRVNIELSLSPDVLLDGSDVYYNVPSLGRIDSDQFYYMNVDWCPVVSISVFANNFDGENKLFDAPPLPNPKNRKSACYVPEDLPNRDEWTRDFFFNPLWMRQNILESLK